MRFIDNIGRTEMERAIDEWIIGFDAERRRKILRRRLIDGLTFERLAEEFELSVRHTKTIVYECEKKIFSHFEK